MGFEGTETELVVLDTEGTRDGAKAMFKELVLNHGVAVVIGPLTQEEAYPAVAEAQAAGVPLVSLSQVIRRYAGKKPIFGVCLGLQAIVEVFGGTIINMDQVFHGVATSMKVTKSDAAIFNGIQKEFQAARYHSWIASNENFPEDLEITAEDEAGGIMAIRHRHFPISAVQFHPESILTAVGEQIVKNFIEVNNR